MWLRVSSIDGKKLVRLAPNSPAGSASTARSSRSLDQRLFSAMRTKCPVRSIVGSSLGRQSRGAEPLLRSNLVRPGHRLLDGAEDRAGLTILHLDADAIAVPQKRRGCATLGQGLHRAQLGNA